MLRTAVDLKEAIEKAPKLLDSIGTCPLDKHYWKCEMYGDYEDDDYKGNQDMSDNICNLKNSIKGKYYHTTNVTGNIQINYNNIKYDDGFDVPADVLQQLFETAPDAPFGDQNKLQTVVDKEIRDAKDISIDYFSISDNVLDEIAQAWSQKLFPTKVIVKPYKINLYGKNGHFELHQDTPEQDMVGTALIALSRSSNLKLEKYESYTWYANPGDCIMFYTDVPHKVNRHYDSNIRGTVAFKIYADGNQKPDINYHIDKVVSCLNDIDLTNFGFLLGHGYSIKTECFKGSDHVLVAALDKMGKKYTIIPIIHKWYIYSYHDEKDDSIESKVYPLTDNHINYCLDRDQKPNNDFSDISFYSIGSDDYVWFSEKQQFCEWVGNESQPEEENSIYITRALIIQ